jgi:hypothetical protein
VRISDTYVGFLYAKPDQVRQSQQQTDFLATLHASVSRYTPHGNVLLVGDFNAKLGACADCSAEPRIVQDRHDAFGRLLMSWCEHNGLMTLTGRCGDTGQPTRYPQGQQQGGPSRIDHVFLQPQLLPRVLACTVHNHSLGSDHRPLCLTLTTPTTITPTPSRQPTGPKLVWNHDKRAEYCGRVAAHQALHTLTDLLTHCDSPEQIESCDALLKQLLWDTATAAGLSKPPSTGKHRNPTLRLPPEATAVKRQINILRQSRQPIPTPLRREWRQHVRAARKARSQHIHNRLKAWLHTHPRIFWSVYKRPSSSSDAILTTEEWRLYYHNKFYSPLQPAPPPKPTHITQLHDSCPITKPVTLEEVAQACQKIGTAKAVGADGIPSEFITHTKRDSQHTSPLHTVLANLFTAIVRTCHMPASWKTKVISPIFKKGDRLNPDNYRPVSVATSLYRIFAAVFAARLTDFVANQPNHLSPSQFAFRRGLSTNHAHFILQTCCDTALHRRKPLAVVHLDISKAYDTLLRDKLWAILQAQHIPQAFINLMQEVYRDCPYRIKANGKLSEDFLSNIGVQQGCPWSPWAYNEYIAEALKQIHAMCAQRGIQLYDLQVSPCTHVGWADDIIGTVNLEDVEAFVQVVRDFLGPLNQHLNTVKTEVLVIQRTPYTAATINGYKIVPEMKLLGLTYNHLGCTAANVTSRKDTATTKAVMHSGRLKSLGCAQDFGIARTMLESDVRATLLFGAPIWGCYSISSSDPMKHPMQSSYSTLPRQTLGLPHGTAHWSVALLFGLMPIQHWIVRDFCRFWNNLITLQAHNPLIHLAMLQQQRLIARRKGCLLGRWRKAVSRLLPNHNFHHCLTTPPNPANPSAIDEKALLAALEDGYQQVLAQGGDPFASAHCPHRRTALTYQILAPQHRWSRMPACMRLQAPPHIKKTWHAFLAAACTAVPVNDYTLLRPTNQPRVPYHHIKCIKCTMNAVADEAHILLHCPCTTPIRLAFDGIAQSGSTLRALVSASRWGARTAFFVHDCIKAYAAAPAIPHYAGPPQPPAIQADDGVGNREHLDSDSTTTEDLGSIPESEQENTPDLEDSDHGNDSDDSLTCIPRNTENHSLLYRARMIAKTRLRTIED